MGQIVNMTAYRFVDLPDRDDLRQPMLNKCLELINSKKEGLEIRNNYLV